jgi:uncharacterized membrane protein YfcA
VDAARVPIYLYTQGDVIADTVPIWVAASAGAILGTFIGVPVLSRMPEAIYRRLLGGLLFLLGLTLLATAL